MEGFHGGNAIYSNGLKLVIIRQFDAIVRGLGRPRLISQDNMKQKLTAYGGCYTQYLFATAAMVA